MFFELYRRRSLARAGGRSCDSDRRKITTHAASSRQTNRTETTATVYPQTKQHRTPVDDRPVVWMDAQTLLLYRRKTLCAGVSDAARIDPLLSWPAVVDALLSLLCRFWRVADSHDRTGENDTQRREHTAPHHHGGATKPHARKHMTTSIDRSWPHPQRTKRNPRDRQERGLGKTCPHPCHQNTCSPARKDIETKNARHQNIPETDTKQA